MDTAAITIPSSTDTDATPTSSNLARARLALVAVLVMVGLSLGVARAANQEPRPVGRRGHRTLRSRAADALAAYEAAVRQNPTLEDRDLRALLAAQVKVHGGGDGFR